MDARNFVGWILKKEENSCSGTGFVLIVPNQASTPSGIATKVHFRAEFARESILHFSMIHPGQKTMPFQPHRPALKYVTR